MVTPNSKGYCDEIQGTLNQYHQMIRDIQEISKKNVTTKGQAFVDSRLFDIAVKNKWDIATTVSEYSLIRDAWVNTIFSNVSEKIQNHYIKEYENTLKSFEEDLK